MCGVHNAVHALRFITNCLLLIYTNRNYLVLIDTNIKMELLGV